MGFIDQVKAVWPLIMQAPWGFAPLAFAILASGWAIGRFMYSQRMALLKERVEKRDETIADLKEQNTKQLGVIETLRQPDGLADRVQELSEIVDGHLRPRGLSQTQYEALIAYLLPREKADIDICYTNGDQEAEQFAYRFLSAFNEAGWTAEIKASLDGKLPNGLPLQTGLAIVATADSSGQKLSRSLARAMEMARIPVGGHSFAPNNMDKPNKLFLHVGRRPHYVRHEGPPPPPD
ncbi:MAG: hypothetical protein EOS41_12295 [Mesorhizobium sp.]|uniref:hypothetical protein n=1 Tax=Mesorhizobium sp. TaxID=1871066 RepID=UPI000FE5112E|nr:hypothetical protein [Mesorhizobium sp.]RWE25221.1 MAG: hypothetical protein EOS41_12295 [Mesorhizobium sp.]